MRQRHDFHLKRDNGDFDSDFFAYRQYVSPLFQGYPRNVLEIWEYAFSEMFNNVIDHSLASEALVRVDSDSVSSSVTIVDNGIGIFHKLQEHFGFGSADEAICELFKGKLTTDSANHSGEGIFFMSRMMDDFLILSDGKVFRMNKYEESALADIRELSPSGTCVRMSLSNASNKRASEIFGRYADSENGFSKTSVPLKNIFDSSPVSRSQAKRICNRMENFDEVTLDFDGLEWMGQGFAHQVFVVFALAHPETRLLPINMGEAVEKMYRHVIAGKSTANCR